MKLKSFYVNSYPRSGNTWFRYMLLDIFCDLKVTHQNPIFYRSLGFKRARFLPINFREVIDDGSYMIKSHGRYETCHEDIPVIYLVRDGRDCLYSYWHFNLDHRGYNEPWEQFFERFIVCRKMKNFRERYLDRFMGNWSENVLSYLERDNVLVLRYEDLRNATLEKIKEALYFIGVQKIEDDQIKITVLKYREQLKNKEKKHDRPRGGLYGWKNTYSQEQNRLFWSIHKVALSKLQYFKA